MAEDINKEEEFAPMTRSEVEKPDWGKNLMEWKVMEFVKHEHTELWYIMAGLIVALILLYSYVTANFLFALIIVLTVVIIFIYETKEPKTLPVIIWEDGVQVGSKFYDYDNLDGFYLIYKPNVVKKLYLEPRANLRYDVDILIDDQDPVKIREILLEYLPENLSKETEPISDALGRVLKI